MSKVTSFRKYATRAAIINPGNNPSEPTFLIKIFLSANFLKGSENVVITHKIIATAIEIG